MGSLFSKRRLSNKKLIVKRPKRHKKILVVSESSQSSSSSSESNLTFSVKQRAKHYNKKLSQDDLGVHDFEEYVASKKKKRPAYKPVMSAPEFERKCIEAHNQHRKNHGVSSLTRKKELSRHAQEWANKLAKSGNLKHSGHKDYGENVAMTTGSNPSGEDICKLWYDEIGKYNFRKPGFVRGTGHFTQVVWKGSTHVGIGIATGKEGTYVVANYEPAGNISNEGYFEKNVFPCEKKGTKRLGRGRSSSSSSSSSSDSDCERSRKKNIEGSKKGKSPEKKSTISVSDFERKCINAHNNHRKNHGVSKLSRKSELSRHAQEWANKLAKSGNLKHSGHKDYGENVAMTTGSNPSGEDICKLWYDEIKKYNFGKPGFVRGTGHFTQVVWKGSTHVGIGIATGKAGTYVVANYEPAGNISNEGYFEKNVLPCGKKSAKRFGRSRSSSSSSSSSLDSNGEKSRKKRVESGTKTETNVKTNVEELTDEKGRKVRKTTKTTTTITTKGGTKSTSTKTEINTEYIGDSTTGKNSSGKVTDDFKQMQIKGGGGNVNKMSHSDKRKFEEECIDRHNELRRRHGAPKLKRDSDLTRKAQKWAEYLLDIRKLKHSSESDLGENVGYKYSSDKRRFTGGEITDMWYDEIKNFDFKRPVFASNTGHFTQVVWELSQRIGVGVATDGKGTLYAVANYSPSGNFQGEFEKNVRPPRK